MLRMAVRLGALVGGAVVVLLGAELPASAHPLSTSAVLLDLDRAQVGATVELPLDELSVARNQVLTATSVVDPDTLREMRAYVQAHLTATGSSGQPWTTEVTGARVARVDGVDNLVLDATLTPSAGEVDDFVLHDDVIIDRLVSHRAFVSARFGGSGPYTSLAMLSWQTQQVTVASAASPAEDRGFLASVGLGLHHIASGSDHLLFVGMLLLPAPLLAGRRRWATPVPAGWHDLRRSTARVVHVLSAFAVGHSCTLVLGALAWVQLPTRVVESGIALSVLVSAVHAVRPLVRRAEVLVAAGFGLLHGLSFAAVLDHLDLSRTGMLTDLLGFNLGIELAQLVVTALVMPSLLVASRTPGYRWLRTFLAGAGAVLATCWLLERLGLIDDDPVGRAGEVLVAHPLVVVGALALACAGLVLGHEASATMRRPPRVGHRALPGSTATRTACTAWRQVETSSSTASFARVPADVGRLASPEENEDARAPTSSDESAPTTPPALGCARRGAGPAGRRGRAGVERDA